LNGKSNLGGGPNLGLPEKDHADQYDAVEDLSDHGEGSMPAGQPLTFNPWLVVDIVGSPGLTGLIGALTIDTCEDITSLDLSAPYSEESEAARDTINPDEGGSSIICHIAQAQKHHHPLLKASSHSVSCSIATLCASFLKRMPGPLDELYPFPKLASERRLYNRPRTNHLVSSDSLKAKELECCKRFKALKNMQPSEINDLAEDMRSIAWRHLELDQNRPAEIWWRRIVTSFLEMRGHRTFEILGACLEVVDCVRVQGRYREAASLHQEVHHKITKLFGPYHGLTIMSRNSLAKLRGSTGDHESEVAIYRELLQIFLLRFGTRSRDTLNFLVALGYALACCGQDREAEALLCIRLQLDFELSSQTDRDIMNVRSAFVAMSSFARSLNKQGRYADVRSVLNCAAACFKDLIREESPSCFLYFYEKAMALKFEGCLFESEEILRAILRHEPDHGSKNSMIVMEELADTLMRTDREPEAVTLQEKVFFAEVEMHGIDHRFSKWYCYNLGFSYARQGRYDDAILLFKQTVEKVAPSNLRDPAFRNEYIDELQDWIIGVEKMKEEARNLGIQRMS
jgi:tetratricopeptide (TPR) repeat protein